MVIPELASLERIHVKTLTFGARTTFNISVKTYQKENEQLGALCIGRSVLWFFHDHEMSGNFWEPLPRIFRGSQHNDRVPYA